MRLRTCLILSALYGFCAIARADVTVTSVFSDHMVLQRDRKVAIFGMASPGEQVVVSIADAKAQATTDDKGKWKVDIGPLKAGGPFDLTIAGNNTIAIKDVLVGEVWLCSGQSNMGMSLGEALHDNEPVDDPQFRMYTADRNADLWAQDVDKGAWKLCSPQDGKGFSAAGYYFARKLRKELNCPVGMVHISWGGTPVEAWTSYEKLATIDSQKNVIKALDAARAKPWDRAKVQEWKELFRAISSATGSGTYKSPPDAAGDWQSVQMPQPFEKIGLEKLDGMVWFRKSIDLPNELLGQDLKLSLGAIDEQDTTFVNGTGVGQTYGAGPKRVYSVGKSLTQSGKLTIDVRVFDGNGAGGFSKTASDLWVGNDAKKLPLDGEWKMKIDPATAALPPRPFDPIDTLQGKNTATGLFNAMIHPVIPYTIRGVIWYQGENNAKDYRFYRELFAGLINDWCERFGQPELPFYFVQLASFNAGNGCWPYMRETQTQTLALPNTAMAVATDVGDQTNIHPKNKRAVGERLALPALALVYGHKLEYSGPMYESMKIEGDSIRLTFTHIGAGLAVRAGPNRPQSALADFTIAGEDQKFVPATATIDGNTVVVRSADIKSPKAVRYGWSDFAPNANLINRDGLPASSFRTDDWPQKKSEPQK